MIDVAAKPKKSGPASEKLSPANQKRRAAMLEMLASRTPVQQLLINRVTGKKAAPRLLTAREAVNDARFLYMELGLAMLELHEEEALDTLVRVQIVFVDALTMAGAHTWDYSHRGREAFLSAMADAPAVFLGLAFQLYDAKATPPIWRKGFRAFIGCEQTEAWLGDETPIDAPPLPEEY